MDAFLSWISAHAAHAHWVIFGAILLAGFNIPISADLMIIAGAFLAATVIPEHTPHLFIAVLAGCYFSAWIAYGVGRFAGKKLCKVSWFSKLISAERLAKTQKFYEKYGLLTLLIGRFIPFGVRNCIFLASGMSRLQFWKFALWDLVACSVWCSLSFYLFYTVGQNYQALHGHLKMINIILLSVFAVSLIGVIWYKRRKKIISEPS
jgi:membrane protein DedA with SNARE-associated domain